MKHEWNCHYWHGFACGTSENDPWLWIPLVISITVIAMIIFLWLNERNCDTTENKMKEENSVTEQKYRNIIISWSSQDSCSHLSLHNKTFTEALEAAHLFGYEEPKWYQFWKNKARVSMYN